MPKSLCLGAVHFVHAGSCWLTFPVKPQHCSISVGFAVTSSQPHDRGPRFKMHLLRGIFAAILAKCWPFSTPSLMLVSQIWTVVKRMPLTAAQTMHTDGLTQWRPKDGCQPLLDGHEVGDGAGAVEIGVCLRKDWSGFHCWSLIVDNKIFTSCRAEHGDMQCTYCAVRTQDDADNIKFS
jgi:hypothetical protein